MLSASRINAVIMLIMFLLFAFATKLTRALGIEITGLEYMLWIFFSGLLVIYNFGLIRQHFVFPLTYMLLFIIVLTFAVLNYFFVEVRLVRYLEGAFFSFLFAFNFLLFYNVKFRKEDFYFICDALIFIITAIGVLAYFERVFISGSYESYFLRGVKTISKDPVFGTSLLNINIILCFVMFLVRRQKKYIFLITFSIITIALMLFLKSLLAAIFICFIFIRTFLNARILKYFFYSVALLFFIMLIVLGKPLVKEIEYKYTLYFGPGSERTPRNALYIASVEIAKDYFPFGSGQGTFGSIPVGREYSDLYYEYNLSHLHGLGSDDALGRTDSHFVFDTHWSSILGEMGFIATFFYVWLWLFPALMSFRHIRSQDIDVKTLSFFISMTMASIFMESIAAPIPGQLQFVIIYTGLGAVGYRMLIQALRRQSTIHSMKISTV